MEKLANVLCAVDLGPTSEEALREADRIARTTGARLTVLHVLPDGFPGSPMSGGAEQALLQQQKMVRDVGGYVMDLVARATNRRGDEVGIEIETGVAHELIVQSANELGGGLIVLAATGKGGPKLKAPFLGSVALHVARHAPASVLICRPRRPGGPVIAATDFSDTTPGVLRSAVAEARERDASLVLLHCLDTGMPELAIGDPGVAPAVTMPAELYEAALPAVRSRLAALLPEIPVRKEAMVVQEPAVIGIPNAAAKIGADLVVVGAPHRSAVGRFVLGSVADAAVRNCPSSVLVTRG